MNKVFKIIINSLLILTIVILASYFILRIANMAEIYSVKTGSMEDNIHVGDYILICKRSNYNVGDVVTYKYNNAMITHRIIKKENDKFITKGDANNIEDEMIDKEDIVGKVILNGGLLNFIVKFKYAIVCVILALYLISCYVVKEPIKK